MQLADFIASLDRCEHGRHSTDNCWNCRGGWSLGSPYLLSGTVIGFWVGGMLLVVPQRVEDRTDPNKWIQERPQDFTVQEWALQARDRIKELEGQ